jgi:probable dihydroxyacetone kinase regulator
MPGANHTKYLLAQSLQELMASVPLEKISVNDIVDHAGVGRNTFYYHFEDKYDLVNWYFQTSMTRFFANQPSYSDWKAILDNLEAYLHENRVFYVNALNYTGQNSLQEYIYSFISAISAQRIEQCSQTLAQKLSPADVKFAGDFLAGAILGVFIPWIQGGMKGRISDYYTCLHSICSGQLLSTFFALGDEDAVSP